MLQTSEHLTEYPAIRAELGAWQCSLVVFVLVFAALLYRRRSPVLLLCVFSDKPVHTNSYGTNEMNSMNEFCERHFTAYEFSVCNFFKFTSSWFGANFKFICKFICLYISSFKLSWHFFINALLYYSFSSIVIIFQLSGAKKAGAKKTPRQKSRRQKSRRQKSRRQKSRIP